MNDKQRDQMILAAKQTRDRAYAPYSNFAVGAAVLTPSGEMFRGCNVENASFGLSICAERVAIASAVASGFRAFSIIAVAAHGGATPCGACRQFMAEFGKELVILLVDTDTQSVEETALSELLPRAFGRVE